MNIKKTINDLSSKEEKKLNCEYDFLDDQQAAEQKFSFIDDVDSKLITSYIVTCLFFALTSIIRLFIDADQIGWLLVDNFLVKAIVLLLGWLGCKRHNNIFSIAAVGLALLNAAGAETHIDEGTFMKMLYFLFGSNIPFFAVILVIGCISVAVNIKFRGLNNQRISGIFELADSNREFKEHMEKMDRTRKYFLEEEKLNSGDLNTKRDAGSADLGTVREKKQNYMDDI